ncbi:hypothetical protein [Duganella qianjiadongensis]|uniref:Uncharacterized protein n=1 Tax=Duganella qianjiadongensis TaxID=2692176 RepID=A0ABW9VK97_9BURK|nr:hypothetical protein [Duganella qianjiadongensis]MYM40041.1 hypothetical protein [Duganella qianjiadongensis]
MAVSIMGSGDGETIRVFALTRGLFGTNAPIRGISCKNARLNGFPQAAVAAATAVILTHGNSM